MLIINEQDDFPLSKEFHFTHNLCAIIYDQLTDLLTNEKFKSLTITPLTIHPDNKKFLEELESGDLHVLDWLSKYKYDQTLSDTLIKHLTLSILSDYVNFVYESLNCARKGKMSVAYALLRKPLTDELLILEQLLSNGENYVNRFFYSGNPATYDPYREKNQRNIIEAANAKLLVSYPFSTDLIYMLRYDKSCAAGVYGISNKAIHIITSVADYRTENQNLNFVFSGPNEYQDYCYQYYGFVPTLLIYTVAVVDAILFRFLPEEAHQVEKVIRALKRIIAAELHLDEIEPNDNKELDGVLSILSFTCDSCNESIHFDRADYELFLSEEVFICSKCLTPHKFTNLSDVQGFLELFEIMKMRRD